ncbi:hypothetical protein CDD81_637 [Ophiocordyceps australis]|uniref:Methyltransferase domain-containing protein n=1 Tax=Ophiocordyceps australis TaxID=1399860 RepID=A0A2C5X8I2_9HYPO|nr:hypothetical protein CDD81_637 [Ophiocordyceps australis]
MDKATQTDTEWLAAAVSGLASPEIKPSQTIGQQTEPVAATASPRQAGESSRHGALLAPMETVNVPQQATNTQIPFNDEDEDGDSALGEEDSVYSSTASLAESIFNYRNIHGRTYQSSKTTEYWGPNDDRQNNGLDIAHHFITMLKGDRLFEAPITSSPTRILDVGTGTGIWVIDMADTYPAAEVVGTDISPIQPTWVPPNCVFQIEDAQLEWTYRPNSFDFVHIRALYGSIADWGYLYRQAFEATKPGGWIEDFEFNITLYSDTPEVRDNDNHIFKRWSRVFLEAFDRIGRTARIGLAGNMVSLMEQAGFANAVQQSIQVPVGGWSSDARLKQVGFYNLAFLEESLEGFALFMLKEIMRWEYAEVQMFVLEMRRAIRNTKLRPFYMCTNVYAQKPKTAV